MMGQPSEPKTLREQISFYASLLAVAISAVTFFFTQITRSERLSIKTPPLPMLTPSDTGPIVSFKNSPQYVVFANSGNRPIAVTELYLSILLSKDYNGDCTPNDDGRVRLTYALEQPLIVRSSDVVASVNKLESGDFVTDGRTVASIDDHGVFLIKSPELAIDDFYVRACLSAFVVTSNDSKYESQLLSSEHVVNRTQQKSREVVNHDGAAFQPKAIYTKTNYGLF